ncbi:hypothetical protein BO71DRAFT_286188, partial [Aspergillus ellipticus CBS 707.79]
VRSIPFLLFIDDFGAHRNMYRAIKGFYMTPAGLSYRERCLQANLFILTLAPHAAELSNTVSTFEEDLSILGKGFYSKLHGQQTIITATVMAFTGDIPQQAKNSSALGYQSHLGYRSCYISSKQSQILGFNIHKHGRYYFEIESLQKQAKSFQNRNKQLEFYKANRMQPDQSSLEQVTPTLDLVLGRPYDLPHSDWQGIGARLQKAILRILTPNGRIKYIKAIQF